MRWPSSSVMAGEHPVQIQIRGMPTNGFALPLHPHLVGMVPVYVTLCKLLQRDESQARLSPTPLKGPAHQPMVSREEQGQDIASHHPRLVPGTASSIGEATASNHV